MNALKDPTKKVLRHYKVSWYDALGGQFTTTFVSQEKAEMAVSRLIRDKNVASLHCWKVMK